MIEDYNILKLIPPGELTDMMPSGFSFHTKPWPHQVPSTIACMAEDGFILQLDLGTGKTKVTIDTIRNLKRTTNIHAIVLCRDAARDKWVEEVFTHSNELTAIGINPKKTTKPERIEMLCDQSIDLKIISIESFRACCTERVPSEKKGKNREVINSSVIQKIIRSGINVFVIDESFPGNTKVLTPAGYKRIDSINPGDKIINAFGASKVKKVFQKTNKILIQLHLSNGKTITTTINHPMFTRNGWLPAYRCREKYLLSLHDILEIYDDTCKDLRVLQKQVRNRKNKTKILFKELLCEVKTGSVLQKKLIQQNKKALIRTSRDLQNAFRKNEEEQSNVESKNKRKNDSNQRKKRNSSNNKTTWGEWAIYQTTNFISRIFRLGNGSCGSYLFSFKTWLQRTFSKRNENTIQLQNRCWKSKIKNWHRNRWIDLSKKERISKEKRFISEEIRVENITLFQQGSTNEFECSEKGYIVYDLEIEGHPSFFVEDILVHNSHKIKDPTTITFEICAALAGVIKYRYLLTGTFFHKLNDVWAQYYVVDKGETFGKSYRAFLKKYFKNKPRYIRRAGFEVPNWVVTPEGEKEIMRLMYRKSIRYDESEVKGMPEKVFEDIRYELTPEQDRDYRKLLAAATDKNYTRNTNFFTVYRQVCSGFIISTGKIYPRNPKLELLESIAEIVVEKDKLVVFHEFNMEYELIGKLFKKMKIKYCAINGSMKDNGAENKKFMTDDSYRAIIVNTKSGSESIDLQVARYAVFFSSPLSVPIRKQAIKRIHRGEISRRRFYYDFTARNTIEATIYRNIKAGVSVFDKAMDPKRIMKAIKGEL